MAGAEGGGAGDADADAPMREIIARMRQNRRGSFRAFLADGAVVTVLAAARREDLDGLGLGPLYQVAPDAAAPMLVFVRGRTGACDLTSRVAAALSAGLHRTRQPAAAGAVLDSQIAAREQHGVLVKLAPAVAGTPAPRLAERLIDRYRVRGQISERQWVAADKFHRDWETGPGGGSDRDDDRPPGCAVGGAYAEPGLGQLHAIRRFEAAVERLRMAHASLADLVRWVVVDERSIEAFAARRGEDRKHWAGVFHLGLIILADHYRLPGGDGRARMRATAGAWAPDLSRTGMHAVEVTASVAR